MTDPTELRSWYDKKTARRPRDTFPWWAGSLTKTLLEHGRPVLVWRDVEGEMIQVPQIFRTNRAETRRQMRIQKRRPVHDGILVQEPVFAFNAVLKPGQGASPKALKRLRNKAKRIRKANRGK